jgi:chaperonin GroES
MSPAARTPKLRSVKAKGQARAEATDNIRLTADRILVRVPDDSERRSKGGLLIPATAATPVKRCVWSDVILVGPETRNVKAGDRVLFLPHAGLEVDVRGETFMLLRERDVQAITSDRIDLHGGGQYL